ncbi:MAG: acyl-CoA dehydrogenase family protein [Candidatus Phaeomarinobacter sp.]
MTYRPPVRDMSFALNEIAGLKDLCGSKAFPDLEPDLIEQVLEESGRMAGDLLAPLNWTGDQQGAQLGDDGVKAPDGFADAYKQWFEAGWCSIPGDVNYGGQGLPLSLAVAVQEYINQANMAFGLCPMLSQGAVESLTQHGSEELREKYLPKLLSGEWTGSMNLTEPQAGSVVGALKAKAEPVGDGSYKIKGTKIYITWGDHDMADNIVHLVLARLPDAPEGTKGVSLFLVPKYFVNDDGSLGAKNDVKCIGLEKKLGIHASPTCVMAYGEEDGAIGWLIGEENKGMRCMFTMMNNARLNVGMQGVGIAERAYQQALDYAMERKQGKAFTPYTDKPDGPSAIIDHPDVRRMLLTMKAMTEATRGICYANAVALDLEHNGDDDEKRKWGQGRAALLTPISKGFSTDVGVDVASIGIQIHGGMGFIEETGAAQHLRDSRIAPIYEGTNGIQAIDLVSRKLTMDGGKVIADFLDEIDETAKACSASNDEKLVTIGRELAEANTTLREATDWLLEALKSEATDALGGATPYLKMIGTVAGGAYLAKGALAAHPKASDDSYLAGRVEMAAFYAANILPQAAGLKAPVTSGASGLYALGTDLLAS